MVVGRLLGGGPSWAGFFFSIRTSERPDCEDDGPTLSIRTYSYGHSSIIFVCSITSQKERSEIERVNVHLFMEILFRNRISGTTAKTASNNTLGKVKSLSLSLSFAEFFPCIDSSSRTSQITRERVHLLTHIFRPIPWWRDTDINPCALPSSPHNRSKPVEFLHREAHRADSSAPTAQSSSANLMRICGRTTKSCVARVQRVRRHLHLVRSCVRCVAFVRECFAEVVAWD